MASGLYNKIKYDWMTKAVNMTTDTLKTILLNSSHSFTASNNLYSDISANELATAGGYTAGGATLTTPTVTQDNTNNLAYFDADDAVWNSATFTAHYAVIYDSSVSNHLIACIDFGSDKSVSSGTFTIQWSVNGILKIT